MRRLQKLRKPVAVSFIAAYLLSTAVFQFLHVLGDSTAHPVSYFWTWDMFPGYTTASHRRVALGRTQGGKNVRLYPGSAQKFRGGVHKDMTRIDILPGVQAGPGRLFLQSAVETTLEQTKVAHRDDPVTHVYLLERYSVPRFNLPDDIYESVYGRRNPRRKYWRTLAEAEVDVGGNTTWSERP